MGNACKNLETTIKNGKNGQAETKEKNKKNKKIVTLLHGIEYIIL